MKLSTNQLIANSQLSGLVILSSTRRKVSSRRWVFLAIQKLQRKCGSKPNSRTSLEISKSSGFCFKGREISFHRKNSRKIVKTLKRFWSLSSSLTNGCLGRIQTWWVLLTKKKEMVLLKDKATHSFLLCRTRVNQYWNSFVKILPKSSFLANQPSFSSELAKLQI